PDSSGVFNVKSLGVSTNRDSWVYNFSRDKVEQNVVRMVNNVNSEIDRLKSIINKQDRISKLKTDPKFVSWTAGLRTVFSRGKKVELDRRDLNIHTYRPFTKKWLYYERDIIERPRKW